MRSLQTPLGKHNLQYAIILIKYSFMIGFVSAAASPIFFFLFFICKVQ